MYSITWLQSWCCGSCRVCLRGTLCALVKLSARFLDQAAHIQVCSEPL